MPRRKLRAVPDVVWRADPESTVPKRSRFISVGSLSMFKSRWPDKKAWLTIGQLERAYCNIKRVNTYGLELTPTDLDLLRFVFTFGAPSGGQHHWRVMGSSLPLARGLSKWTKIHYKNVYTSLRRLRGLELLEVREQEVWTTHQLHRMGAEILWCDLLSNACPDDFDQELLDWYTVTRDIDRIFKAQALNKTKVADRRTVMLEVQRRCISSSGFRESE
jgi:hypothetical protein